MTILQEAFAIQDDTIALHRDLHCHPELGFEEIRTSKIIAERLGDLGFDVQTGVAKKGVVGLLRGTAESPVLLLRFDKDGLPIQEEMGVDFESEAAGIMHACGHDSHVAIGLSVAEIDSAFRTMGSEDFSYMMQGIPGCFMKVGSSNPEQGLVYGHHHPKFNIDETCLPYAVAILSQSAIEILHLSPASIIDSKHIPA